MEEGDRADFEVSFHFVNLHEWENQALCTGHTLDSEEALVEALQTVIAELETVINLNSIVDQSCCVDD